MSILRLLIGGRRFRVKQVIGLGVLVQIAVWSAIVTAGVTLYRNPMLLDEEVPLETIIAAVPLALVPLIVAGGLFLLGVLGGARPLVLVDGMETVAYDEIAFDRMVDQIHAHLHHLTVQPADVTCIPIATVIDANVCGRSSRMTWYNGPTVVDALANRIESALQ